MASAGAITFDGSVFRAAPWRGAAPAAGWASVFTVATSDAPGATAMLGVYAREGEGVVFIPRFPPTPGTPAHARFRDERGVWVAAAFMLAAVTAIPSTTVAAVFPSTDVWPANQLKFYIEFSAPMSLGCAWSHVRLSDRETGTIDGAFVEIEQELWDREGRRLTILFDPARIKRGLVDHDAHGLPLIEGRTVTLEIDGGWPDARGFPLAAGLAKTIRVGPELRAPVTPQTWRITPPRTSAAPLIVTFPAPLDYGVAARALGVRRAGAVVRGAGKLSNAETQWVFAPDAPWRAGAHEIVVSGFIEDLAGNRLARLFDVDTFDPAQRAMAPSSMSLVFEAP